MTQHLRPNILQVSISLLLTIALLGCGMVRKSELKPDLLMLIALDVTTTNTRFLEMRDKMIPHILARLRSRDVVHWTMTDRDPERHIQVKPLGKMGSDEEIVALYQSIHTVKQTTDPKEFNDTGAILAYAKRIGSTLEAERQHLARQGKPVPRATRVVLAVCTDGELPPVQSLPQPGVWPAELDVWFLGLESKYEAQLKHWATTTLGLPETQLHVVRMSDWPTDVEKAFGPRIDRAFMNTGLLKRLGVI